MIRFKFLITICCLNLVLVSQAQQKRNLLTDNYSRKFVNSVMTKDHSWIKYPAYTDRESWSKLPAEVRAKTIAAGEKYLDFTWPSMTATMYLDFTRKGDRSIIDNANSERRRALQTLLLAELMEGKGRFIDDLINGIFIVCEQTFWGSSAHFYLYGFDITTGTINSPYTVVPDFDDPIIDLMASDMAVDLSWIWYFMHDEFDKISPIISKRMKYELQNKILNPYYERYDLWWIAGWGEGDFMFDERNWTMNNWTAWITSNMLITTLLMEDDLEKKQNGVYKTICTINDFLNMYPSDGACSEGPGYWRHAGGKLFDYLNVLKQNTNGKIDIFSNELVKNMGRYIYRAYIGKVEYYINFSSAAPQVSHDGGHIFRYGRAIEDPVMKSFGAFLLKESNFGERPVIGSIGTSLENLFDLDDWQKSVPAEPLPDEFYFQDSEIALARDKKGSINGFYFAAWGGNNSGGHNHNDNGTFILYYNGNPVLMDVGRRGVGTNMHNLPMINGIAQQSGGIYKTENSEFNNNKKRVFFSTDIAKSYPDNAQVEKWVRSYTLERDKKFTISDNYLLKKNEGNTKLHFMSGVPCRVISPGIIELAGEGFTLYMKFNQSVLAVTIENAILGDEISRIKFDLKNENLSGKILIEITKSI